MCVYKQVRTFPILTWFSIDWKWSILRVFSRWCQRIASVVTRSYNEKFANPVSLLFISNILSWWFNSKILLNLDKFDKFLIYFYFVLENFRFEIWIFFVGVNLNLSIIHLVQSVVVLLYLPLGELTQIFIFFICTRIHPNEIVQM